MLAMVIEAIIMRLFSMALPVVSPVCADVVAEIVD